MIDISFILEKTVLMKHRQIWTDGFCAIILQQNLRNPHFSRIDHNRNQRRPTGHVPEHLITQPITDNLPTGL